MEDSFLYFHGERYDLRAWAVMPNHAHLLFLVQDVPMWKLIESWKTYTSKEINKLLGRSGRFWQEGYWDTYMRNDQHETRARRYVENNPVKARLTTDAKQWPWSSARYRDAYQRLCLAVSTVRTCQ